MLIQAWHKLAQQGLEEDVGHGDITTELTIPKDLQGTMNFTARQELVICGLPIIQAVYDQLNPAVSICLYRQEGEKCQPQDVVASVKGPVQSLLMGERVVLNVLTWLSGIATITRAMVDKISDLPVKILDTRKTRPGQRIYEKYAVKVGGGHNHRFGLYDAILVKDNHVAAKGGMVNALHDIRRHAPHGMFIEVEVDRLEQIPEVLAAQVDGILLDNMSVEEVRQAVLYINHRVFVEASGGINPANLREMAETGVDAISLGYITHSAPYVDIGADWEVTE
ncbi:carboxylating nicotinate-nucleotide diphosphorylase [Sulfobacillus thermosulfidooxidans]|uniref:carboxylating nicotinate-nucleotide diphosphorylase n=1 Tax=Sulfobacillus thermosulfidooxidans TaxID=28034 RepID=UPI00096B7B70|nr:carboxylating nicotinate-nucleotide diphosphorylase [Sulfobacillus thermosulfidooxidans]OLZ08259.1 nicotinate-nucleotide diphosphorylase (carboxylating) [Sulfobacillus thermosulfidooxidans]OLZ13991.1 nicotinate-nucleotide diphosphorylase (carboxylating) [Sulfobacillus thermosulfidooxidans]OLZ19917.1 nicotinate-nucleotide diphosphorylase (carboxylating) [Sulfobacillus thermosulfidooxidans]